MDDYQAQAIHVDVCPDCSTPTTWHGLDAPGHCPHGFERRVPAEYVPIELLEEAVEAIRKAPHAHHCNASAWLFPGPCSCWKRKWLAATGPHSGNSE